MGRTARTALQVFLALLGLAAFLLLLDVLFNPTAPIAKGVTDQLKRDTWIAILLGTLAVLFVLELTLLGRGGRAVPAAFANEGEAQFQSVYLLGCPACGTVFEHRDDGNGRFRCTNCMREGNFHPGAPLKTPVRHHDCERCGNAFEAYKDPAECPVCHLLQAVA
ncbi:MAG TPA: hypothetical protein VM286_01805 [Candidatus Thermoplasmatota archaeon]|nr:hypothetical protein [Candidatus Thermoplasmatota archaeon]